jgi:hypothetical protein
MALPVLVSATPTYKTKTVGRGKKKRTVMLRVKRGAACAFWTNPGEPQVYRNRKSALRRRNPVR